MDEGTLSIRQVAKNVGVSSKTIRYWESRGLIAPPTRTHTNYRCYTQADLKRILFIRKAQSLGFTLAEIRRVFELAGSGQSPCDAVIRWAGEKARVLEGQIRMLGDLKARLEEYRQRWVAAKKRFQLGPNEVCRCIESVAIEGPRGS